MKKIITIIFLSLSLILLMTSSGNYPFVGPPSQLIIEQPIIEQPIIEQPIIEQPIIEQLIVEQPISLSPKSIDDLINALIYVESRGIDSAIGDKHLGEPSIGVLQIRPIMVREVNRICKKLNLEQRFTLKDRFDRQKSIHMFMIWKMYYHTDDYFEAIARSWNGGPGWRKIRRTENYWAKVEKQLNNN